MSVTEKECLRAVPWRDLLELSALDVTRELGISAPWLIGSWAAAAHRQYLLALACSFMFFLTGLRQVHNAHHYALGLSRTVTDGVMLVLSVIMLGSMHAVQVNHLRHHRHCMEAEDVEAMSARLPAWRAVVFGPLFPLLLHRKALSVASPRQQRWILAELAANLAWLVLVIGVLDQPWLTYHIGAMAAGQCLTAFFAVWTVHHGCEASGPVARTIRNRAKAFVTYDMFYHLEHHLFPAVPTCKLPVLARRLDDVLPALAAKNVF